MSEKDEGNRRYGLNDQTWQAALNEIRHQCIQVACQRDVITYSELAARLTTISPHPGSYVFHRLLREMCHVEAVAGRGFLCAVVVAKATGMPGQGFFRMLAGLGRDCHEPDICWRAELEIVYATWSVG